MRGGYRRNDGERVEIDSRAAHIGCGTHYGVEAGFARARHTTAVVILLGAVHREPDKKAVRGEKLGKFWVEVSSVRLKKIRNGHTVSVVFFDEIADEPEKVNTRQQRLTALKTDGQRLVRAVARTALKRL